MDLYTIPKCESVFYFLFAFSVCERERWREGERKSTSKQLSLRDYSYDRLISRLFPPTYIKSAWCRKSWLKMQQTYCYLFFRLFMLWILKSKWQQTNSNNTSVMIINLVSNYPEALSSGCQCLGLYFDEVRGGWKGGGQDVLPSFCHHSRWYKTVISKHPDYMSQEREQFWRTNGSIHVSWQSLSG